MYPAVSKVMARQIESSEENKTIETIIARDGCFNWPYYNGQGKDILWKAGDYSVINYKIKKMWSAAYVFKLGFDRGGVTIGA